MRKMPLGSIQRRRNRNTSTPAGYTWHHVEAGRTMLLVPSDLHGTVRHTGGASLIKKE